MERKIIFFTRAYNDIDHITPIVYKINKENEYQKILVINIDLNVDYSKDYRIKYIKSLGVEFIHLIDLLWANKRMIKQYWNMLEKCKQTKFRLLTFLYLKLFVNRIKNYYQKLFIKVNMVELIKKINDGSVAIYVFDQSYHPFYIKIVEQLKKSNIISIAVPHGHNMFANEIIWSTSFEIKPNDGYKMKKFIYNYVVFENHEIAERYKKLGVVDEKQVKVLGSSRFSKEWVKELRTFLPRNQSLDQHKDKLKIVFMLSKPHYNGHPEEVERTIKYLCLFENTVVAVKPHTRGMKFEEKFSKNVIIVDNSYHSAALIDWADLTVFTMTSVIWDCLQMDKPALYLKNTHANKLLSEKYFKSWQVECRDDLRFHLENIIKDNNYRTYSKKDRKIYISTCIEPAGENVLTNYSNFITSHFM